MNSLRIDARRNGTGSASAVRVALLTAGLMFASAQVRAADPPASAPAGVTFDSAIPPTLEIKKTKVGLLLVKPVINGQDAGWFIFDTGAGMGVVSTPYVERLHLRTVGEVDALGVGGSKSVKTLAADTLTLGPATLRDVRLIATDLSFLREPVGEEIAGVIGYELLSVCVAEVDPSTPKIALHDPKAYAPREAAWTPMKVEERIPTITATVEGREGRFRLDTGSNDGLTIFEPAVRKWNLLEGRDVSDSKVAGVGGAVATKKGTVREIEVGGVRRENVSAMFVVERKGSSGEATRDGRIGMGVLGHLRAVIDYPNERIWLRAAGGEQ